MDYITVKETVERWGVSIRRVQVLCDQGKIPGVIRFGHTWANLETLLNPQMGDGK